MIGAFAPLLIGHIVTSVAIYGMWNQLRDGQGGTLSPGLAVGLNFVPIINLVWFYFSFAGLARAIERYTSHYGIESRSPGRGVCLGACILMSLSMVPLIGLVFCLPMIVCFWIGLWKLAGASADLARWRLDLAVEGGVDEFSAAEQWGDA